MKARLQQVIQRAAEALQEDGAFPAGELPAPSVERPKQDAHGDYATNLALVLAGRAKRKPRDLAQILVDKIGDGGGLIGKTEIAGPGFVNFFITPQAWQPFIGKILAAGPDYGRVNLGQGQRVLLEYVSANPTGPLHVGHGRQAAVGDAIARLLDAAGYSVHREYYLNDAGNQVKVIGRSVWIRYQQLLGIEAELPEDHYRGDYVKEVAAGLHGQRGDRLASLPEDEAVTACTDYAVEVLTDQIRGDLKRFGVTFDRWFSERAMVERGEVEEAFDRLRADGYLEDRDGALWFLSESRGLGDEKDRVVVKADGSRTYFATDIAYHYDKLQRKADWCIDVWGADHHGYVPRVRAAIQALGLDPEKFSVVLVQFVNLVGGRMGKRSGNLVTLRDLLDEVGSDAARFFYLMRSQNNTLDFDMALAKEQTPDNPVFYVQYGHARLCQLVERARREGHEVPAYADETVRPLVLPEELGLIRTMQAFPELIGTAAAELEPHRIAFYLQELLSQFHSYYTRYKSTERVVSDDEDKTRARLLLCEALRWVVHNGLRLLGVDAPTRMDPVSGDES